MDSAVLHKLFEGAYGAFVNTDGFTVGAAAEMEAAFNIVRFNLLSVTPLVSPPKWFELIKVGNRSVT